MADKKSPPTTNKPRRFMDEQTNKRIHEHLTIENDHVSEEDIRNVKTGVDDTGGENPPGVTEKKPGKTAEDEIIQDNSDTEIETPWNILES